MSVSSLEYIRHIQDEIAYLTQQSRDLDKDEFVLREIPRSQRFAERPPLPDLTSGLITAGKTERNKVIYEAHVRYGGIPLRRLQTSTRPFPIPKIPHLAGGPHRTGR